MLGRVLANASREAQTFELEKPGVARVVKLRFLSHHGAEYYCTLTNVAVFGRSGVDMLSQEMEMNQVSGFVILAIYGSVTVKTDGKGDARQD